MSILPISKRTIFAVVFAAVIAAAACAGFAQSPPSLYEPSLHRELSKEERWALDTEMMNQIGMKHHNSRRFDIPEPYEKRAQWFESLARWDPTADLLQQLVDFRRSAMRDNEPAYMRLIEQGRGGDVGSACLAAAIYHHFEPTVTAKWRVTFEQVAQDAVARRGSGHPVCASVDAVLYTSGGAGTTPDQRKARTALISSAVAGAFADQMALVAEHLDGALRFEPREVALSMCWRRVADTHSTLSAFQESCEAYRHGIAVDAVGRRAVLPEDIQKLVASWCVRQKDVNPQDCARLEEAYEGSDGK